MHDLIEKSMNAGIVVALQAAPDQIVLIPKPLRMQSGRRIEQQPRRLYRSAGDDDRFCRRRFTLQSSVTLDQIGDSADVAALVRIDAFRHGMCQQFAVSGCERARNQRVMGAVLAV